jgi:hypothetical protein
VAGAQSRFCIACGAALAPAPESAGPAAPAPASASAQTAPGTATSRSAQTPPPSPASTAATSAAPGVKAAAVSPPAAARSDSRPAAPRRAGSPFAEADVKRLVEAARRERAAVYQRLGRVLLGACYEGKLPYERLTDELARQAKAGIGSIRKSHAALAARGVCPRCLEASLAGDPPTCARCRLVVPAAGRP